MFPSKKNLAALAERIPVSDREWARNHIGCNVTTCPNGKCQQTGECIDLVAARNHVKISERHSIPAKVVPYGEHCPGQIVASPPLAPNQTGTDCADCVGECAYRKGGYCPPVDADAARRQHAPNMRPTLPRRRRVIDADSATRKTFPMAIGLLDYFPDALAEVARVSHIGNEKHNPGEAMHHARGKSMDHADCIVRHLVGRGGFDGTTRESAAMAWRALALLQEELEAELGLPLPRGARSASG